LISITVTPANSSIAKGTTVQLTATGIFSDSSTQNLTSQVDWVSGSSGVAAVSDASPTKGLVTGVEVGGPATITATFNGITGSATVTVTNATLSSITVTPAAPSIAKNTTVQLTATGNFSDGTTSDLTTQVSWTSGSDFIAQVSNVSGTQGLVKGLTVGNTSITATLNGSNGSTTVTVTNALLNFVTVTPAAPSIAKGTTAQLTATGHFSDGTTADITTQVSWTSGSNSIAQVSNVSGTQGLVKGLTEGSAVVTATAFNNSKASATVTVTAATLTGLIVTPANPVLHVGDGVHMMATAVFSDGTSQNVTIQTDWVSSDPNVADIISSSSVQTNGRLDAKKPGTTTITATVTLGGVTLSGSTLVTVSP
jgi:uncharacterized protein YjdB